MKVQISKLLGCATLALASVAAHAGVVVTDTTYRDFDNSSGFVLFDVTTHGFIDDLNVAIEFSKCDNPYIDPQGSACVGTDEPYENEIMIWLEGPDGRVVRLVNENTFDQGDTGVGRVTMVFDDEGRALGRRVQAGSFRPVESLTLFDDTDMFGKWKLFFEDTAGSDPLEVFSSRLDFRLVDESPQTEVPEPGSALVFGAGLLGLAALRGQRKRA